MIIYFYKFRDSFLQKFQRQLHKKDISFQINYNNKGDKILQMYVYEDKNNQIQIELEKLSRKNILFICSKNPIDFIVPKNYVFSNIDIKKSLTASTDNNCFFCKNLIKISSLEHVISDWILEYHHIKTGSSTRVDKNDNFLKKDYGGWKINCCQKCNSYLSSNYEIPLSTLLKQGYSNLKEQLTPKLKNDIKSWLSLIYIKAFQYDINVKNPNVTGLIGLNFMDDLNLVFRHIWTNLQPSSIIWTDANKKSLENNLLGFGSLFIFEMSSEEDFDFATTQSGFILLKISNIGFILNLMDSSYYENSLLLNPFFKDMDLNKPIQTAQLREVFTQLVYFYKIKNYSLTQRYIKNIELFNDKVILSTTNQIQVEVDKSDEVQDYPLYKKLIYHYMKDNKQVITELDKFYSLNSNAIPKLNFNPSL